MQDNIKINSSTNFLAGVSKEKLQFCIGMIKSGGRVGKDFWLKIKGSYS